MEGARRAALSVECRGWAAPHSLCIRCEPQHVRADNALLYWRVDGTLAPLGPPTRINAAGDNTLFAPSRAVETCSGIAVAFTTQTVAEPVPGLGRKLLQGWGLLVLDETHLINRSEVFSSIDALTLQGVVLGVGGRSLLACETHYLGGVAPYTSPSCREFDLSGAPLGGSFFVNDPRPPLNVRSGLNQVPVVVATRVRISACLEHAPPTPMLSWVGRSWSPSRFTTASHRRRRQPQTSNQSSNT